jgi:hypothetical protein
VKHDENTTGNTGAHRRYAHGVPARARGWVESFHSQPDGVPVPWPVALSPGPMPATHHGTVIMGPLAGHRKGNNAHLQCSCGPTGKTRKDHQSGKHARRLSNRHADSIREGGGKEFGGKITR